MPSRSGSNKRQKQHQLKPEYKNPTLPLATDDVTEGNTVEVPQSLEKMDQGSKPSGKIR